jgi:hypothetical protein
MVQVHLGPLPPADACSGMGVVRIPHRKSPIVYLKHIAAQLQCSHDPFVVNLCAAAYFRHVFA